MSTTNADDELEALHVGRVLAGGIAYIVTGPTVDPALVALVEQLGGVEAVQRAAEVLRQLEEGRRGDTRRIERPSNE